MIPVQLPSILCAIINISMKYRAYRTTAFSTLSYYLLQSSTDKLDIDYVHMDKYTNLM